MEERRNLMSEADKSSKELTYAIATMVETLMSKGFKTPLYFVVLGSNGYLLGGFYDHKEHSFEATFTAKPGARKPRGERE
jgi:hypothetical protein